MRKTEIKTALLEFWRSALPYLKENAAPLIFFPAFFLYEEVVLRAFSRQGAFTHFFLVLFFTLSAGLFFAFLTTVFPPKVNRILRIVLAGVFGFIYGTQCLVRSAYRTYMSFGNLLSGAGNVAGKYSGELWRSIFFGLPKFLLFMLPFIGLILLAKFRPGKDRKLPRILCVCFLLISLILFGFTSLIASHGKTKATYGAQFTYEHATETFGLFTSTRLSAKYRLFGNKHNSFNTSAEKTSKADKTSSGSTNSGTSTGSQPSGTAVQQTDGLHQMDIDFENIEGGSAVQELSSYIASLEPENTNEYTGIFKGKNLVMVCAESYTSTFIDPDLTPALWRLTHNGFYFSEYYQPEYGGSTTTGEVAYLLGFSSVNGDESMIDTRFNNNYFTMANQLQRENYTTVAFHNGSADYYDRVETHINLGYSEFIANETGIDELIGYHYPDDEDFFKATVDLFINKEPFCAYYMTLSGHAPYDVNDSYSAYYYDYVDSIVGDKYADTSKAYICHQMELEKAMEYLLQRLEETNHLDDTVIVLVGDHYPYGLGLGEAWGNDDNYIPDILGHSDTPAWNQDENGLIIWSGCLEGELKSKVREISEPVFSLDVLPTLSNLFGLTYDSRFFPGRDVFSDADPIVYWNGMTWLTDRGFYDAATDSYYPRDGYDDDPAYVREISRIVENKMLLCSTIIENDYFGLLFGPDEITTSGRYPVLGHGTDYEAEFNASDVHNYGGDDVVVDEGGDTSIQPASGMASESDEEDSAEEESSRPAPPADRPPVRPSEESSEDEEPDYSEEDEDYYSEDDEDYYSEDDEDYYEEDE